MEENRGTCRAPFLATSLSRLRNREVSWDAVAQGRSRRKDWARDWILPSRGTVRWELYSRTSRRPRRRPISLCMCKASVEGTHTNSVFDVRGNACARLSTLSEKCKTSCKIFPVLSHPFYFTFHPLLPRPFEIRRCFRKIERLSGSFQENAWIPWNWAFEKIRLGREEFVIW